MITLALSLLQTTPPDPHRLPIGSPGTCSVAVNQIVNTATGKVVDLKAIARAAVGRTFVFVGESHDNPSHHVLQAKVIEELAQSGRPVCVGFEMFTRPNQPNLNPWTLGWWSEEQFIERADWKKQWGFDFALYRPIFEVVRKYRLPMAALNVPREWVRAVGRGGPSALPTEAKDQVPPLDLNNGDHRSIFGALMGGHPPTGTQGENIYSAQVLWDTAMADSAIKFMEKRPYARDAVMVVVAGIGHMMYGQGINYRIWKRTGQKGLDVASVEPEKDDQISVSRGIGDFVYCGPAPTRKE